MDPLPKLDGVQFRADLHCHTTFSDGTLTPEQIIDLAKQVGLCGLSITDHDTYGAYERAIPYAKEKGIRLGTGVEFAALFRKKNVHILAYDFSLDSDILRSFCAREQLRRKERNRGILDKLAAHRMPIPYEELDALESVHSTIGRPHIAQLMIKRRYVDSLQMAFALYIGDGKKCYVQSDSSSVAEVLSVIGAADGKAFLAHPHFLDDGSFVRDVLQEGFHGIECYYGKFPADKEKRWIKVAQNKNLLISGGSDFHGDIKPFINLGCSWVDETLFRQIFQKYQI